MFNVHARARVARVFTPAARGLLRLGVTPDAVTTAGTVGVCLAALVCYPRGQLFLGSLLVAICVLADMLDGTMARLSGRSSRWGAFLDSTLDRVADAAIFAGLLLWFTGQGEDRLLAALTLFCLVVGALTSYVKARAEGLGMRADVGIAERSERLIVILLGTGLAGLGVPYVQAAALWVLAVAGVVTVVQRMLVVRGQATSVSGTP